MGKVMHVIASFVSDTVCRRQGASERDAGPVSCLYLGMQILQEVLSAELARGAMARILDRHRVFGAGRAAYSTATEFS